jgi:TRAP-type mannitol/chloroaromatic compound transport system substrate-binding protein
MTMLFGLLPACGGGTETPIATGGPGATTTAPIAAGEKFQWRWQTTGNAGTATYWTFEEMSANVKDATGGRVIFDAQPSGAIVGTMEIFDAVSTGAIEVGSA